jgi:uncharacterized protein (DUF2141 family)
MTKIITITILFICSLMSAQNVKLTVAVSGLKNDTGVVKVGLYNSDGTFLKATYKSLASEIKDNKAVVTFDNLPAGEYAISTYHDENSNGKLDRNAMGNASRRICSFKQCKRIYGTSFLSRC